LSLLSAADETYHQLPPDALIQAQNISKALHGSGCRPLNRRGHGMDFYEARDFNPHGDDRRRINKRLSEKAGKNIVVDRQIEIPQHVYIWRDPSETMNYASKAQSITKRTAADIMAIGLGKHLVSNEDAIGIMNGQGTFRSSRTVAGLAHQLTNLSFITGKIPSPGKRLPRDSVVILLSDFASFVSDPAVLDRSFDHLVGQRLQGHIIMVLDPQEIDFTFKGAVEFQSMDQQQKMKFGKAESLRDAFRERIHAHIEWVRETGLKHGFDFTLQRTDKPLHEGLLPIFGLGQSYAPIMPPKNAGPKP
jgi:uncharacterized protein (DUF58 family)